MVSGRMRLGIAIVGVVLAVCLAAALAAEVLRKPDPQGYGPDVESEVVGFCTRSAPDVQLEQAASAVPATASDDEVAAACRCAYRQLVQSVPWARFVAIDDELRSAGKPPAELLDAVRACGAVPS
jgi:hypothetical protein